MNGSFKATIKISTPLQRSRSAAFAVSSGSYRRKRPSNMSVVSSLFTSLLLLATAPPTITQSAAHSSSSASTEIGSPGMAYGQQGHRTLQQQQCSCAPRSFTITLDLSRDCLVNTLVSKGGIEDTDCTIEVGNPNDAGTALLAESDESLEGVVEEVLSNLTEEDEQEEQEEDATAQGISIELIDDGKSDQLDSHQLALPAAMSMMLVDDTANQQQESLIEEILASIPWLETTTTASTSPRRGRNKKDGVTSTTTTPPSRTRRKKKKTDDAATNNKRKSDNKKKRKGNKRRRLRRLQEGPSTPVSINSVTFIEIDSSGNVINVDDQFTNVDFVTGSSFGLQSISGFLDQNVPIEDQTQFIPETGVLFYIGQDSSGEEVRGRFVWQYTNGCGDNEIAIEDGEEFGWSTWSTVEDQVEDFCPATGNDGPTPPSPTNSPVDNTPSPVVRLLFMVVYIINVLSRILYINI